GRYTAGLALVDLRREVRPFDDDRLPGGERRGDLAAQHLGPCRGEEQRLGDRCEFTGRRIEQEPAQRLAGRRRTRLAQMAHRLALGPQGIDQAAGLERLAAAVPALEDDVAHSRVSTACRTAGSSTIRFSIVLIE